MFPIGGLTKVSKVVLFTFCEIVNRGKEKAVITAEVLNKIVLIFPSRTTILLQDFHIWCITKSSLKEEMRLIGSILSDDTLNGCLSS
jgi:hypothetical protein